MNLDHRLYTGCASEVADYFRYLRDVFLMRSISFLFDFYLDGMDCVFVRNVLPFYSFMCALEDYIWVLTAPNVSRLDLRLSSLRFGVDALRRWLTTVLVYSFAFVCWYSEC